VLSALVSINLDGELWQSGHFLDNPVDKDKKISIIAFWIFKNDDLFGNGVSEDNIIASRSPNHVMLNLATRY
jgi:hypothetical protein